MLVRTGRRNEALAVARRGVDLHPGDRPLQMFLADLAQGSGDYEQACTAMQAAFALAPGTLGEVDDLCLMLRILGRREEAAQALARGLEAAGRQRCLELRGALRETVAALRKHGSSEAAARQVDFTDFRRLGGLLDLQDAAREAAQALKVLRAAAASAAATDFQPALNLFNFLFGLGRVEEALNLWLDTVRPLCGDRRVLPERAFQRLPKVKVPAPRSRTVRAGPAMPDGPERTFGLVIQGPVHHRGFDSRENIRRLVDDFGHRFRAIVLSTWEGEADPGVEAGNFHALFSRDTTPHKSRDGIPLRNRVRQMFSTKAGIDRLRELGGVDYVVKIRTDLHSDLNLIVDHLLDCERTYSEYLSVGQKNFIFVPSITKNGPYVTDDIIFAGQIDDLDRFVSATLNTQDHVFRPYKNLPENDMILKHLYCNLRPVLGMPDYLNFPLIRKGLPPVPYPADMMQYWAVVVRHSMAPLPAGVLATSTFRGGDFPMNFLSPHRLNFQSWLEVRDDWFAAAVEDTPDLYGPGAEPFDQVYFYFVEKAAELAGATLPPALRRCLSDYRAYVDKTKAPLRC